MAKFPKLPMFEGQFTAIEDAPNFVVGPLKKSESIRGRVFVHCALCDGKISRISVVRAGECLASKPPDDISLEMND